MCICAALFCTRHCVPHFYNYIFGSNSDQQLHEMMTSHYKVVDNKKVSMKAAKNLTDEATCWICLDSGPDEEGNPLVRDCSCRGNSG